MDESYLNEDIPDCYGEYAEVIISANFVKTSKTEASRKPTINDLMKKLYKDASCRILTKQIDNNDGVYLVDDKRGF